AYEGERAMFEGYARNKYTATGVIHWMLNNAWPSMMWHLYDYYLRPAGGYFGAKRACEPLHVQYSPVDRSVVVVNDTPEDATGLHVAASVLDFNLVEKFTREAAFDANQPESGARVSVANTGRALAFQVHLELIDPRDGREILPVFWDDNYFELLPGERREIRVAYPRRDREPLPRVTADAWNT